MPGVIPTVIPGVIKDRFDRPLRSLRISVTDRCNLRCQYCMPEPDYTWLPRESLLDFEEIAILADAFAGLGVGRVRPTRRLGAVARGASSSWRRDGGSGTWR